MRKITLAIGRAFQNGRKKKMGNTHTDGKAFYLHGHKIAELSENNKLWLSHAGWPTRTTKERLNGILSLFDVPFYIYQHNFEWYMRDTRTSWDSLWINGMIIDLNK